MAKTLVVEPGDSPTKIPFLRGILTHSLQESGLPFDEAYGLASEVRDELSDKLEITTAELREVSSRLQRLLSEDNANKLGSVVDNVLLASNDLARITDHARRQLEVIASDEVAGQVVSTVAELT